MSAARTRLGLCALALLLLPATGAAQAGGRGAGAPAAGRAAGAAAPAAGTSDQFDLRRHGFLAIGVSPHPWSTVVALTLVIPGGSGADPQGLSGASWLLAQSMLDALEAPLQRVGARAAATVDRNQTIFQVLAVPGRWHEAYQILVEGIFAANPDLRALDRRRSALQAVFGFERNAPVREFQLELARLLAGAGSAWSHDPRGTPESVARISGTDLAALRVHTYRQENAVLTLVGALDAEPGVRVHPGGSNDGGALQGRRLSAQPAWRSGRRQVLERDVTSAWIGAAFPARGDVPRTVLDFLAERLEDELNPSPRDPGLYGTRVRVEDLPEGTALVVESAVLPEDQARWVQRIERAIGTLEARYRDPGFFSVHVQRFRNARLLEDGAPEAEGLRVALDLLRDGRPRDLAGEIASIQAAQVTQAISTMGEPRILVFGPNLGR